MLDSLSSRLIEQKERISLLEERYTQLGEFICDGYSTELRIQVSNMINEFREKLTWQQQPDITSMINAILKRARVDTYNVERSIEHIKLDFDEAKEKFDSLHDEYTKISTEIDKAQQIIIQQEEQEEPSTQQTDADSIEIKKKEQLQLEIVVFASKISDVERELNEIKDRHDNLYNKLLIESDIIEAIRQRERITALEVNLKQLHTSIFDSLRDRNTKILSEINDIQQLPADQNDSELNKERLDKLRDEIATLTTDIETAKNKPIEIYRNTCITELSQEITKQRERIETLRLSFIRFNMFARLSVSLQIQISNISSEVQGKLIWQRQPNDIMLMIVSISGKIYANIANIEIDINTIKPDFDQTKETFDLLCCNECTRISSEIDTLKQENDTNFDEIKQQLRNTTAALASNVDAVESKLEENESCHGNCLTDIREKLLIESNIIKSLQRVIATLDNLFKTKEYFESKLDKSNKIKSRRKYITIAVAIIAISIVCPVAIIFFKIQKLLFLALRIVIPFAITGFISTIIATAFFIYQKRVSKAVEKNLKDIDNIISEDNLKLNSLIEDDQNDILENFCQTSHQIFSEIIQVGNY